MKVRYLKTFAGPDGVGGVGSVVDVTPEHARQLVESGAAKALERFPAVEVAANVEGGAEQASEDGDVSEATAKPAAVEVADSRRGQAGRRGRGHSLA